MAEPGQEARDRILSVFLREYNREHGTDYAYSEDGNPDAEVDWLCRDRSRPGDVLKLQHVRAWADEHREIVHPRAVENYVIRRLRALADGVQLTGYFVSLHVMSLPKGRKDREYFVEHDMWDTILYATRQSTGPEGCHRLLWFNDRDIDDYYGPLREHVSDLEVMKSPDGEPFRVAWSTMDGSGGAADGVFRASEALKQKALRYGKSASDVVLVIDFEVIPYYEAVDVPDLRAWAAAEKIPFREVWITAGQWAEQMAHRIWPPDPPAGS